MKDSLLDRFQGTPVMMDPRRLPQVLGGIHALPARANFDDLGDLPEEDLAEERGAVAVISVRGPLISGADWWTRLWGFVGYEDLVEAVQGAMLDDEVSGVVLNLHSPGGEASGMFEAHNELRALRGQKPLVALANSLAASACYGVAAACDQVYMTQAAEVGSIGVVMAHADYSKAQERFGLKVTLLHQGERKVDGNPHEPLGETARAELMGKVETLYSMFVSQVAEARGLDSETIRAQQSRCYVGLQVEGTGLVDGVRTLSQLVQEIGAPQGGVMPKENPGGSPQGATTPEIKDAPEAVAEAFPEACRALEQRGATRERARIASIDKAAAKRPEFAELAETAKAEGWDVGRFALEALDVTPSAPRGQAPGASYLRALEDDDLAVPEASAGETEVAPAPESLSHLPVDQRVEAEWKALGPKGQSEWTSKETFAAIRKHELEKEVA